MVLCGIDESGVPQSPIRRDLRTSLSRTQRREIVDRLLPPMALLFRWPECHQSHQATETENEKLKKEGHPRYSLPLFMLFKWHGLILPSPQSN